MSDQAERAYYVGEREDLKAQLEGALGIPFESEAPTIEGGEGDHDVVFLEVFAGAALTGLPGGNAFATCRALKNRSRRRVFMLVYAGDDVSQEIARFCMADGCFQVGEAGIQPDSDTLKERLQPHKPSVSVDALLERLERDISSDEGRQALGIQRLMQDQEEDDLTSALVDAETGLFDGPFASFKIDEEFKRANRFHQPLSLVLLDIGFEPGEIEDDEERRMFLADVASVFLNECRDIDIVARFTAQVFMLLLPGTGSQGAAVLTRRILESMRERHFLGNRRLEQVVAGAVTVPSAGIRHRRDFLTRAEACLELARRSDAVEDGLCMHSG